ncbi:hypothetical protein ACTXG7_11655 [Mycolicibacterium sp. Dal123E01]|uniref:hypothetical protein n=1 Tax=Mycolicibacterium sp. Dal123E01 TaxID=3457578 RepID=UPI00403E9A4F
MPIMVAGLISYDFRDFYAGGFIPFPNRLFGVFQPTQAVTYLHLRRYNNMREGSRPSVATVVDGVRKGRRTVQYAIKALEEAGEVKRESRGRNRPCRYIFTEVLDDSGKETFTKVPNWVLERGLSPDVLMTYVAILEVWMVDKTLRLEDIARKCRISKSTADRTIQDLERRRLIAVHRDKYRIKRNRYGVLPRQLSDQGSTETAHSKTASHMGSTLTAHRGTETAHRGTETAHWPVPTLRTNKTHLQQDSSKEDSFANKTRLHTLGCAEGIPAVGDSKKKDGQGRGGVRERIELRDAERRARLLAEKEATAVVDEDEDEETLDSRRVPEADTSTLKAAPIPGYQKQSVIKTVVDDDGEVIEHHPGRKGEMYTPPGSVDDSREPLVAPREPETSTGLWSSAPWEERRSKASRMIEDMNASALMLTS